MSDGPAFVSVAPGWWLANAGGVALTGLLAARTGRRSLRLLFTGAVLTHAVEAVVTYERARRAGSRQPGAWALQTLAVGFPSLGALRAATAEAGSAQ
jgi:Transmembrane protein 254